MANGYSIDTEPAERVVPGFAPDAVDRRTKPARRLRDLRREFESLARPQPLDDARKALCARAASMALQAELIDAKLAAGEDVDANILMRLSSSLSQLLKLAGCVADPKPPSRRRRARDDGEEFPEGDADPLVGYCRSLQNGSASPDPLPNSGAYQPKRESGIFHEARIDPGADQTEPEERRQPSLKRPRTARRRVRLDPGV